MTQVGIVKLFKDNFDIGVRKYLDGDFDGAIRALQVSLRFKPNDGPAENLISYMTALQSSTKPIKWEGFRSLSSK